MHQYAYLLLTKEIGAMQEKGFDIQYNMHNRILIQCFDLRIAFCKKISLNK